MEQKLIIKMEIIDLDDDSQEKQKEEKPNPQSLVIDLEDSPTHEENINKQPVSSERFSLFSDVFSS